MTRGTIDNPIDLAYVLSSRRIIPGDVLILRGGTYSGNWVINIAGTDVRPITIKPYPGEVVTIDGSLKFNSPHVHVYDLEIIDTHSNRFEEDETPGVYITEPGCRLIGCHVSFMRSSGVNWFGSGVGEVSECWIHDNGGFWHGGGTWGHGLYSHNNMGGTRLMSRNLFGNSRGDYAFQIYSGGSNYLRDYVIEDNVIYGDPVHTGGGLGLRNLVYQRNVQFGDYMNLGRYSMVPNDGGLVQDNLFIQLMYLSVQSGWTNLVEQNNIVWGGEPTDRSGYIVEQEPASWSKFVPFTLSQRWAGIQATLTNGVFDTQIIPK